MIIYCLEEFKKEFEKLSSKKHYRTLEKDLIAYFSGKKTHELLNGTRLNNSSETPYIKKRLKGSGGFRFYFLVVIKNDSLYLMFIHPKTGPLGSPNITDNSKAYLYKKVLESIHSKNLFKVDMTSSSIQFTKLD